jgi:hypothetical protein
MASMQRLIVSALVLFSSTTIPVVQASGQWEKLKGPAQILSFPSAFQREPPESPPYMIDNTGNKRGLAPNNGKFQRKSIIFSAQATCPCLLFLFLIQDTTRLIGINRYIQRTCLERVW